MIVGKWNRYILTPEWVGTNIFGEMEIQVEFPINRPDLAPRYKTKDNILFMPAVHRCQFLYSENNDEVLEKVGLLAKKLTTVLTHTPISGVGVNFGLEENSDQFALAEMFNFPDVDKLIDNDLETGLIEIKRTFSIKMHTLNLGIAYDRDASKVFFNFNYHYDVATAQSASELCDSKLIIENRDRTLAIMNNVYGLELEELSGGD